MTAEDKQLLFKDLCSRFPYGVIVETQIVNAPRAKYPVLKVLQSYMLCDFMQTIENVIHKPYLRPLSSMTEEESAELSNIISEWYDKELFDLTEEPFLEYALLKINYSISPQLFDWLNKKMFAYRHINGKNMFELGLAIEVTEENNPYK